MGKWTDILLGTSDERKKKHRRHELRKIAREEQKESNKNMRTLYRERTREEKRVRQRRNTEHKDASQAIHNQRR